MKSFLLFFLLSLNCLANEIENVETFLNAVTDQNEAFDGYNEQYKGFAKQNGIGDIIYSPVFFVNSSFAEDKSQRLTPSFSGTASRNYINEIGISKKTSFGTDIKLSYGINKDEIIGANSSILPIPSTFYTRAGISLKQSLLASFFDEPIKVTANERLANAMKNMHNMNFQQKALILDAKSKYYNYAILEKKIKIEQDAIQIAEETYKTVSRKSNLNLAEKADLYQIEAFLEQRKYDLEMITSQFEVAKEDILSLISSKNIISQNQKLLDSNEIIKLKLGKLNHKREDILAQEEAVKQTIESYKNTLNQVRPDISIFATYYQTGRDKNLSQSQNYVTNNSNYYTQSIGLNFSVPLDVANLSAIKTGIKMAEIGSKKVLAQTIKQSEFTLKSLQNQFEQNKKMLITATNATLAQKKFLATKKIDYSLGRASLFELCNAQLNYATSELNLLTLKYNTLVLFAHLKTYEQN